MARLVTRPGPSLVSTLRSEEHPNSLPVDLMLPTYTAHVPSVPGLRAPRILAALLILLLLFPKQNNLALVVITLKKREGKGRSTWLGGYETRVLWWSAGVRFQAQAPDSSFWPVCPGGRGQ